MRISQRSKPDIICDKHWTCNTVFSRTAIVIDSNLLSQLASVIQPKTIQLIIFCNINQSFCIKIYMFYILSNFLFFIDHFKIICLSQSQLAR